LREWPSTIATEDTVNFPTYKFFADNNTNHALTALEAARAPGVAKATDWLLAHGFFRIAGTDRWGKARTSIEYTLEAREDGAVITQA
jgi:lysozyme family protein